MTNKRMGDGSVDPAKLKALVAEIEAMKSDMDDARSEMGTLYKNAENDLGINRMALKQAIKLKKMESIKRAEWRRSFENYNEILGNNDQGELKLADAA